LEAKKAALAALAARQEAKKAEAALKSSEKAKLKAELQKQKEASDKKKIEATHTAHACVICILSGVDRSSNQRCRPLL